MPTETGGSPRERRGNGAADGEAVGFDARRAALTAGAGLVLVAAAGALLVWLADWDDVLAALRRADPAWLALCVLGQVLAFAGYTAGYRAVAAAAGGPVLAYWAAARVVGASRGARVLGTSAGEVAVDFWALRRAGGESRDAGRRVVALNTVEWFVFVSVVALAAAAALVRADDVPEVVAGAWLAGVAAAIVLALLLTSDRGRAVARRLRDRDAENGDADGWGRRAVGAGRKLLADFVESIGLVRHVVTHPVRHAVALGGFAVYWAGQLLTLYGALRAVDVELGPLPLLLGFATGYLVSASPLPLGAAGAAEAALAFSLALVGVELASALLAALVFRGFTFWLAGVPAVAFLVTLPALADELPESPRASR